METLAHETYLEWYKNRMKEVLAPENYSLMSSCVGEPWDLLMKHKTLMTETDFNKRFQTSNAYGLPSLIHRISGQYRIPESRILTTQGVTSAIFLIATSFLQKGETVLVERPGYQPLWQSPQHCGARIIEFMRPFDKPVNPDDLSKLIDRRTRLVIITDLHNPTGWKVTDKEIMAIKNVMTERSPEAFLVVDEIYRDFENGCSQPASLLDDRIISTSSLTKVYGLSVLRCGWIVACTETIERMRKVQILMSGIGSRYLEALSTIVFDRIDEYQSRTNRIVQENRSIAETELMPLFREGALTGRIPEWGCVCFLKVHGVQETRQLTDYLELRHNVYCVPGGFFGATDHVRIGFGDIHPERLKIALGKFRDGLFEFLQKQDLRLAGE